MPNHAPNDTLLFTRCINWNTETCPHLTASNMQLSIMNQLTNWLLLDDIKGSSPFLTLIVKGSSPFLAFPFLEYGSW